MDNLTHSLVGALIGQAGLKRRTGLAMPALVIGANLPDLDAACFFWLDGVEHLGFRRGITHGPPAMLALPLLLAGGLWALDRWQARRGKRPEGRLPVSFLWLWLLSLIACLSHPALDWLNSYGIRLLEPFSSRWFYGDTLFIIDIWIWTALLVAFFLSRRAERSGAAGWRTPARIGLSAVGLYILGNGLITGRAEAKAAQALASKHGGAPALVVANPQPLAFWRRELLWRDGPAFGAGEYSLGADPIFGPDQSNRIGEVDMADLSRRSSQARAFLFWSRMPVAERVDGGWRLTDQRFANPAAGDRFAVVVEDR